MTPAVGYVLLMNLAPVCVYTIIHPQGFEVARI